MIWTLDLIGTIAALVLLSVRARAEAEPTSLTEHYSPYELEAIANAERTLGTRLALHPEGELIEQIDVLTLEPIEPRDPLPSALNVLHVPTRRFVIERELMLRAGDHYQKVLADESSRNLRALPQLSVVMCEAFEGSAPDRVRLVVITKDIWSLLLDFDAGAGSRSSSRLVLEPEETNLAGTHQRVAARYALDQATRSLGSTYVAPRLFDQWLFALADANLIWNLDTGHTEGSFGTFEVVQPFRSNRSDWSWFGAVSWRHDVARQFKSGHIEVDDGTNTQYLWYRQESLIETAMTRSFGWAAKQDISATFRFSRQVYRLPGRPPVDCNPPATAADRDVFACRYMPRNDARVSPGIEWHSYTSDFLRTYDLETLGLQEDYRTGHDIVIGVAPTFELRRVDGTKPMRGLLSLNAALQETIPLGDGILRASATWGADATLDSTPNASVTVGWYLATPRFGVGRLIQAFWLVDRYANDLNVLQHVGGTDRLRGYGENARQGRNAIAINWEYRTPGLDLFELQFGGVLFLDTADAFDSFHAMHPAHSTGVGLRMVVPQVERAVFRLDVAVPLSSHASPAWYFAFGQAFNSQPIRATSPPVAP